MDLSKLSNITVWDVRNAINKVKNVVLNYTEMECKVEEATGPEPWGASSTLMREIAEGTFNYQLFGEIMPAIYAKFNDSDPSNWRQVYKALQLIEYLVKNGAERVIDDVRGHITIIKMLRNFYYIDPDGKDKGINVRVRAKELTDFLQDNKRIKEERQKAKENRAKYISLGSNGHGSIGISSRGSNMESISSTNFDSISSGGSMSGAGSQMLGRSYGDIGSMSGGRRGRYPSSYYNDFYRNASKHKDNPVGDSDDGSDREASQTRNSGRPNLTTAKARSESNYASASGAPSKPIEPKVGNLFSFDDDDETGQEIGSRNASSSMQDILSVPIPPTNPGDEQKHSGAKPAATMSLLDELGPSSLPAVSVGDVCSSNNNANAPRGGTQGSNGDEEDEWGEFQSSGILGAATDGAAQTVKGPPRQAASFDLLSVGISETSTPSLSTAAFNARSISPISSGNAAAGKALEANQVSGSTSIPGVKANDIWAQNSTLFSLDSLSISTKTKQQWSGKAKSGVSMNALASQFRK